MNIIVDNYIWFIISGAVILLTTIGYYADKTNFGKKKLSEATDSDSLSNMNNNNDEMPVIPANTPIASALNSQMQPISDEIIDEFITFFNLDEGYKIEMKDLQNYYKIKLIKKGS